MLVGLFCLFVCLFLFAILICNCFLFVVLFMEQLNNSIGENSSSGRGEFRL